jgi:hypothetical protein
LGSARTYEPVMTEADYGGWLDAVARVRSDAANLA